MLYFVTSWISHACRNFKLYCHVSAKVNLVIVAKVPRL